MTKYQRYKNIRKFYNLPQQQLLERKFTVYKAKCTDQEVLWDILRVYVKYYYIKD